MGVISSTNILLDGVSKQISSGYGGTIQSNSLGNFGIDVVPAKVRFRDNSDTGITYKLTLEGLVTGNMYEVQVDKDTVLYDEFNDPAIIDFDLVDYETDVLFGTSELLRIDSFVIVDAPADAENDIYFVDPIGANDSTYVLIESGLVVSE